MINKIENIKNNINKSRIVILGAGVSGVGAARLGKFLGAKVFISDIKKEHTNKKELSEENISFEFGQHSKKCLESDLIIISPGINPVNSIVNKIKNKNIPIVSEIEFASWFTKKPIIAITGSNGKSTVVNIVAEIFSKKYRNSLIGGNIGISFSQNVLKEKLNKLNDVIHILEISSFQLENIYLFSPNVCCLLNVTEDHLERYKNKKDYFNTKLKIITNINYSSNIIFNYDDKQLNNHFKKTTNTSAFSVVRKTLKIKVNDKKIFSDNNELIINQNQTQLIGKHNLYNIIASIMVAQKFRINNKLISQALKSFVPLEHRMERVNLKCKITYINDSKSTNIFSTISAIESFTNNIILILGGFTEGTIDKKTIIKSINKKNITNIICYGMVGPILKSIIKSLKPIFYYETFEKAVLLSIKLAKKNDVVLLSPAFKSYDQFKNFEERGNKFKNIVENYYA